ncbi:NUDIX hydrolase [Nocardia wallacei]|uniref:NUDIX hydrolase n=1 Tax=Nocardia wallacei TaxID=480035 RepID=UPI002455BF84|nr:NUDIX hydrolase [Nocardia wallacei]
MKLDFDWSDDGQYHQYCAHCYAETVERVYEDGKTYYFCGTCTMRHERSIVIDPAIKSWVASDGEYWHESVGVFVRNSVGKFLFFERTIFPFSLTVPSGHVDAGEEPDVAAIRELAEEVGISGAGMTAIATEDIVGDSCRRGADVHRWHAYLLVLDKPLQIDVEEEGENPIWLSLDELREKDLTYPVEFIVDRYSHELQRSVAR